MDVRGRRVELVLDQHLTISRPCSSHGWLAEAAFTRVHAADLVLLGATGHRLSELACAALFLLLKSSLRVLVT